MKNGMILKKDIFAVSKIGTKIAQQFCSTEWFENSNLVSTVAS